MATVTTITQMVMMMDRDTMTTLSMESSMEITTLKATTMDTAMMTTVTQ